MLHAISKKKTDYHRRYGALHRGEHESSGRRRTLEDEVASIVFGPMGYMSPIDVAMIWRHILIRFAGQTDVVPDQPVSIEFELWPRRQTCKLEPDAMLKIVGSDKCLSLLMEFKWESGLSSEKQLQDQWNLFLDANERSTALHIFIGKYVEDVRLVKDDDACWTSPTTGESRLLLFSWRSLKALIGELYDCESRAVKTWVNQVDIFLDRIGISEFAGFSHLEGNKIECEILSPLFWGKDRWFEYDFDSMGVSALRGGVVFFDKSV